MSEKMAIRRRTSVIGSGRGAVLAAMVCQGVVGFQVLPKSNGLGLRHLQSCRHACMEEWMPRRPWVGLAASLEDSSQARPGKGGLIGVLQSETVSLALGSFLLLALVINRLATDPLYDSQSRTDILGVIAGGGLLLNGLSLQDVAVREAEVVALDGADADEVDGSALNERQAVVLRWAADTFMKTLPNVASVLVWHNGRTVLRKGRMGERGAQVELRAILNKAREAPPAPDGITELTYIPDLQVLPGRIEFPYLPDRTQSILIQPFDQNKGLVILGGNKARNLTPRELNRARIVLQKVQSAITRQ